uniref:Putative lipocalin n=1 Tax=Rhipicephalus microplus TaxID=6941 RepID=A0A6G5A582_RHIMP
MALYSIWLWLCLLITVIISSNLATKPQAATTKPKKTGPWLFLASSITYLHLTTRDLPLVTCVKAIPTSQDVKNRTLSQIVQFMLSSGEKRYEHVDYKPIMNRQRVKAFTFGSSATASNITYIFYDNSTFEDSAVINMKNHTQEDVTEVWELWVTNSFFKRTHEDQAAYIANYKKLCNCEDPKQYKPEGCEDTSYKLIIL